MLKYEKYDIALLPEEAMEQSTLPYGFNMPNRVLQITNYMGHLIINFQILPLGYYCR